ncbi:hypothetical protein [Teichococcus vastitatis]|uniref:Uncharacterized protein n=1 Tax=Teichococcus vastitatis TaxID=2307076 RepID=A0ABS9W315_9PROT|nr:hypothetical protein [Pseudoroseomonas vastitatis]MCI0753443.1 hypothetical protein [Pseudoroseomonas vastitatis]
MALAHTLAVGLSKSFWQPKVRKRQLLIIVLRRAGFFPTGRIRRVDLDPLPWNAELLNQVFDHHVDRAASVEKAGDGMGHG